MSVWWLRSGARKCLGSTVQLAVNGCRDCQSSHPISPNVKSAQARRTRLPMPAWMSIVSRLRCMFALGQVHVMLPLSSWSSRASADRDSARSCTPRGPETAGTPTAPGPLPVCAVLASASPRATVRIPSPCSSIVRATVHAHAGTLSRPHLHACMCACSRSVAAWRHAASVQGILVHGIYPKLWT